MRIAVAICCVIQSCFVATAMAQQDAPLVLHIASSPSAKQAIVFKVKHREWVTLQVDSEVPGELHLHAYHLNWKLQAHEPQTVRFEAKATGRFRIEWHAADQTRPASSHVHAPPLASLEVMPN